MSESKKKVDRYLQEGLLALIPVYGEEGSASHVYTCRGDYRDRRSIKWFLSRVTAYYGTNIQLLKEVYAPLLHRANSIPLPLSRETVLLPLKMREPRIAGDTSLGYVNGPCIARVEPASGPFRTSLHFREGLVLKSYTSPATVRDRILQGNTAYREFLRRQNSLLPSLSAREGTSRRQSEEDIYVRAVDMILQGFHEAFGRELGMERLRGCNKIP